MGSNYELQENFFDVFLSFHGHDTRDGFTSHLQSRLEEAGFNVFMDDKRLPYGEKIGEELERAIKTSKISIPILSENYATSKWCLKELDWIMECRDTIGQKVLPIFYKVEPTVVRNQTGTYEIKEHGKLVGEETHFEEWRKALFAVGELRGWKNRNEGDLVKVITTEVRKILTNTDPANSSVVGHGDPSMDPQRKEIESLSDDQKYVFLDIACFWNDKLKYAPEYLWKDHFGQRWSLHIKALKSRSLIELKPGTYCYSMDKQLIDLGREIVQREYNAHPQKRTWLWEGEQGTELLIENQLQLPMVEALTIKGCELGEENCFEAKQFKKLPNLRFIRIEGADLEGNFKNALKNLRCLIWVHAPFNHTPHNLSLENLIVLDLSYSNVEDTWTWSTMQSAPKLKDLDLSFCSNLIHGPDFSKFPNLERLDMEGCERLESITLSSLQFLQVLDTSYCTKLQDIHGLDRLEKLRWLHISGCGAIQKLPNLSKLRNLRDFLAENCISLQSLEGLEEFGSLGELNISGCTAMIQLPNFSRRLHCFTKPNHLG